MIRALEPVSDRDTWLDAWARTGREPFAHPDYVALFVEPGGDAMALLHEQDDATVLLPLIRRALPEALGRGWDAISPYGYGGPFATGSPHWGAFYADVVAWMRASGVVSAFVRASLDHVAPVLDDVEGYRAIHLADNIQVDLTRDVEDQWRHVAHKVRKNVNKARRAGLTVRATAGFADLAAFMEIYGATMHRRDADARYHFDEDFFAAIGRLPGCALVVDVLDEGGRVVSTELVLVSDRRYYSFLGGTLHEAFVHAPNDLLKHAVIEHGHATGREHYVLGGGYQPADGIFRYKLAFDADGVVPFTGVQLVGDRYRYDELTQAAAALRSDVATTSTYFPAYRRP